MYYSYSLIVLFNSFILKSFLFTDCQNVIGIEFNKYFVDIQQTVAKKFKMTQRVNVCLMSNLKKFRSNWFNADL